MTCAYIETRKHVIDNQIASTPPLLDLPEQIYQILTAGGFSRQQIQIPEQVRSSNRKKQREK